MRRAGFAIGDVCRAGQREFVLVTTRSARGTYLALGPGSVASFHEADLVRVASRELTADERRWSDVAMREWRTTDHFERRGSSDWIEHRVPTPAVAGSNPAPSTNIRARATGTARRRAGVGSSSDSW
jgi:hypothetical protein